MDTDDEEDEDTYRDYNDDALDPNEAEEAGQEQKTSDCVSTEISEI